MKQTFTIMGSSHVANLAVQALKNSNITNKYTVRQVTKRGATFFSLYSDLPDPASFKPDDVILFQCFGNSLFKKWISPNVRNVTIDKNPKLIHLNKFLPNTQKSIELEWDLARTYFNSLKCTVFLIDNPIRHVNCCEKHRDNRLFKYQKWMNRKLHKFFQESENVRVLKHQSLLGKGAKILKYGAVYNSLLVDSVHFQPIWYQKIVSSVSLLVCKLGTPGFHGGLTERAIQSTSSRTERQKQRDRKRRSTKLKRLKSEFQNVAH